MARNVQRRVYDATGLTCSIGLAPNKLLAKIASELNKPRGLTIIDEADIETMIWPLPARRINGVGFDDLQAVPLLRDTFAGARTFVE